MSLESAPGWHAFGCGSILSAIRQRLRVMLDVPEAPSSVAAHHTARQLNT